VFAVIGLTGDDKGNKASPTNTTAAGNNGAARAGKAAQNLGAIPALRYSGTFSSGGDQFQAQLTVTKAGSATGTITVGGSKATLVSVDGKTYLKAPKGFWRGQGGVTANPEDYANRWSKAPDSALNLDVKQVLAAGSIVQALQGISSYQPAGAPQDINGTPAVKVTGADAEYYLSTSEPPKLLRIVGTGSDTYQFDVTEVSAGEAATVFQQLRDQVKALSGARDPSIRFINNGLKNTGCGVSSCTIKMSATSVSIGGSAPVRAVMLAKITAGSRTGRTLGTCSDSASAGSGSGKKVNLSCTVRGGAWSSWARSVRGTASYYIQAHTVAEATGTDDLLSAIDQEQQNA
jgi:hypothetical protein